MVYNDVDILKDFAQQYFAPPPLYHDWQISLNKIRAELFELHRREGEYERHLLF